MPKQKRPQVYAKGAPRRLREGIDQLGDRRTVMLSSLSLLAAPVH
jgi:hypothetical protein